MSSADVSTLVTQNAGVVVGTVSALVLAIVNYIKGHVHDKTHIDFLNKVAAIDSKVAAIDQQVQAQKTSVATGIDVLSNVVPGLGTTLAGHSKQIQDISNQLNNINTQLQRLQGLVPPQTVVETKPA